MNDEALKYIILRIVDKARDTAKENDNSEFQDGKSLAYYEVFEFLKSELKAHDQDLKDFGLDIDLEKEFL